jgi:hypothetical protein
MHPSTKVVWMHGFSQTFYRASLGLTALSCLLLGLVLGACSETQRVPLNECGNHIVEDGEDCDGGIGCNAACRFTCAVEGQACPAGWGCDKSEGVCRTGKGEFKSFALGSDNSSLLQVADFDGDGRDDLLAFSPNLGEISSVYYFNHEQGLERTVNLPAADGAATADMNDDQKPDVLLTSSLATSAFRSTPSRSFSPIVGALKELPGPAKLLATDIDCDGLRDILLLGGERDTTLSRLDSNGVLHPIAGDLAIGASELLDLELAKEQSSDFSNHELTASGAFLNVTPCGMLALPAPPGTPAVDVYGSRDGGQSVQRLARINYDSNGLLPRRWFFADSDGDSNQDLILAGLPSSDPEVFVTGQWVSYGNGDGTFAPKPSPLDVYEDVLTAGELDSHVGTDFFPLPNTYLDVSQARALDLTGDMLTDVAAVGRQRRIDVYRGHPSGLQSLLRVPLRGVPQIEDVGDFDGDGISDLLVSEAPGPDKPRQTASILFAPVTSATAGAVELASFESIQQLSAGYLLRELDFEPPDASTDIAALFTKKDEKSLQLGFLEGGADRLLRSRLPTGSEEDGSFYYYSSSGPAIGHFHSDALELALFRTDSGVIIDGQDTGASTRLDLLTISPDGISYVRRINFPGLLLEAPFGSNNAGVVTADLDQDGLDEIYVSTAHELMQLRGQDDTFSFAPVFQLDAHSEEYLGGFNVQDANSDGTPDLTIVVEDGLRILLAKKGSPPGSEVVVIEDLVGRLRRAGCDAWSRQYTFMQADADPEQELVVTCLGPLSPFFEEPGVDFDLELETKVFDFDLAEKRLTLLSSSPGVDGFGTDVVTGDFDGDGVQDMAIGSPLTVMFGMPR